MEYEHKLRKKHKWIPWLNEVEKVLLEEGREMRASVIFERTKDKLYWVRIPKSVNAAAQILRFDKGRRFYRTEKQASGYHKYGLKEWES
tara:strand:+ start:105 stop:371 length:267 start_codon:yes stop_codon:yes gene_type:complete